MPHTGLIYTLVIYAIYLTCKWTFKLSTHTAHTNQNTDLVHKSSAHAMRSSRPCRGCPPPFGRNSVFAVHYIVMWCIRFDASFRRFLSINSDLHIYFRSYKFSVLVLSTVELLRLRPIAYSELVRLSAIDTLCLCMV